MTVSIVTGPDGAHATPELADGDFPVGHDVSEVGANLCAGEHDAQRSVLALCHCELLGGDVGGDGG